MIFCLKSIIFSCRGDPVKAGKIFQDPDLSKAGFFHHFRKHRPLILADLKIKFAARLQKREPVFADRAAERIESIYRAYDIENSNVDTYLFILTDEGDDGLCRIVVGKSSSLSHSEHRYYVQAVLRSDEFLQYRDEIEQAFSSREFYADRAFSFW